MLQPAWDIMPREFCTDRPRPAGGGHRARHERHRGQPHRGQLPERLPRPRARPTASNLNFVPGLTIPNLVLVPLGPGGTVTFYNAVGTVNVIADLVDYFN